MPELPKISGDKGSRFSGNSDFTKLVRRAAMSAVQRRQDV
jgi:hypothetical protein